MAPNENDRSWFLRILEKYRAGKSTIAEKEFIEQYLDNAERHSELSVPDAQYETSIAAGREKLMAAIREENKLPGKHPVVITMKKYWWAAASIVLIVGSILWLARFESDGGKTKTVAAALPDVQPGYNKAKLTLADGSTILLDSAARGVLANQGATTVLKMSDGQLQYQSAVNKNQQAEKAVYNILNTPRGGQYNIRLPDGTMAWLNAASSIKFPTVFNGDKRIVEMSGEVYFEVAKNSRQPFIVQVNSDISVEVLGTQFNVNAYKDESAIKATLLEGSVNVNKKTASTVKLVPGQQAVSMNDKNALEVNNDFDMEEIMAWKNGYFKFNRTDIKTVMRQIARWYDVDVSYEGKIPDDRFIGKIPRQAPAAQVLKVLEEMDIHFRLEGKKLIVTP